MTKPQMSARRIEDGPVLEVEGLVKEYRGRRVVNEVGLSVGSGEIVGLLGKNGSGKTTTVRMTMGLLAPDEGRVRFRGKDVTRLAMYERARLGMGYVSEEPSVFRGLTVEQNLSAILETTTLSAPERVRRRDELVEDLGLVALLHSKAATLRGVQRRRLEIARALLSEPSLMILDEPFSGVGPNAMSDVREILFRLRDRGIGILLTHHSVREALDTTDRAFIILDGEIISSGDRDQILNHPSS